jgi:photosynthetic reaction center cytochrome c subunit
MLLGLSILGGPVQTPLAPSHAATEEYNRALGVACEHCHVADQWKDDGKQAFRTAQNMLRMVRALNTGLLKEIGEITCWTCHGGQTRPSRLPRAALDAELSRWPDDLSAAPESQKLTMTVYSVSLGVDCGHCHSKDWKALEKKPIKLVPTMLAMFSDFPKYMPETARTQCWMCHKGGTRPERHPRVAAPPDR